MDAWLRDLRFALRSVLRRPLFATVAAGSIAIGIAANTAVFSVVETLLLRPLPGIAEPERVVELGRGDRGRGFDTFSWPDFADLREGVPALETASAYRFAALSLSREGAGERVMAAFVNPAYFDVFGVDAALGRVLAAEEDEGAGEHPVAVVSHAFWTSRLGGDPSVVGATVRLNRQPHTVVGVLPRDFRGHIAGFSADLYLPFVQIPALDGGGADLGDRRANWHQAVGRLAPGVSLESLRTQLDALSARLAEAHPETNARRTFHAAPHGPVPAAGRAPARVFLGVLTAMVVLLLLATCANVAGMLLARAASREREVAVRLALGAGRSALVRQLTVEALVVFVLGGAVGTAAGAWVLRFVDPGRLSLPVEVDLSFSADPRVLLAAVAATLATGVVFGLLPALRATRLDLLSSLKTDDRGASSAGGRLRAAFVTGQVGLSLVLVMTSALFLRALQRAASIETGFDPAETWVTGLDLSLEGYGEEEGAAFQRTVLAALRARPGVREAALAMDLPLDLSNHGTGAVPDGWDPEDGRPLGVEFNVVSDGYFEALAIPVLRGRGFEATDRAGEAPVAVVSRSFAEAAWPGGEALGRTVRVLLADVEPATVVGVVEDVKNTMITDAATPFVYLSLAQSHRPATQVVVRAPGGATAVVPMLRSTILEADPSLSLTPVIALERYTAVGILPQRIAAGVSTLLGALALLLSGLGVYGVVAHAVSRRTREIGIRMALGSDRARVRALVLRRGFVLALPGLAVGALLAAGLARAMRGMLLGVGPADPVALGAVAGVLLGIVLLASLVPARRASRIEPVEALRAD